MRLLRPCAAFACFAILLPAARAQDAVIDVDGSVFGLPFGATADQIQKRFGKPAGEIRLDDHRNGYLYGKSCLLLCYDGKFDAVRISDSILDFAVAKFMAEQAPFSSDAWALSNGIKAGMDRKQVKEIVNAAPEEARYQLDFSSAQCAVRITFSRMGDMAESDDAAYRVFGLLMARKGDGGQDHWSEQLLMHHRTFGNALNGRKVLGFLVGNSLKGVRVTQVYQGSPADNAGIKPGDLITALNGASVVGVSAQDFTTRAARQDASELEVTRRDGSKRTVKIERADGAAFSGQIVGERVALSEVGVGDAAPDFEVATADGAKVKLSELKGSPVMVNFTATWCGPCKLEAPFLVEAYAKYKARGFKMVSVYLDAADKDVFAYAKTLGVDWPIHTDGKTWDNVVARTYGVSAIPTNALIGADGKILVANVHAGDLDAAIKKALDAKP